MKQQEKPQQKSFMLDSSDFQFLIEKEKFYVMDHLSLDYADKCKYKNCKEIFAIGSKDRTIFSELKANSSLLNKLLPRSSKSLLN